MRDLSKDKLGHLYTLGLSLIILSSLAYAHTTLAFAEEGAMQEDNATDSTMEQEATLAFAEEGGNARRQCN